MIDPEKYHAVRTELETNLAKANARVTKIDAASAAFRAAGVDPNDLEDPSGGFEAVVNADDQSAAVRRQTMRPAARERWLKKQGCLG